MFPDMMSERADRARPYPYGGDARRVHAARTARSRTCGSLGKTSENPSSRRFLLRRRCAPRARAAPRGAGPLYWVRLTGTGQVLGDPALLLLSLPPGRRRRAP
jgi:hypothetical protein